MSSTLLLLINILACLYQSEAGFYKPHVDSLPPDTSVPNIIVNYAKQPTIKFPHNQDATTSYVIVRQPVHRGTYNTPTYHSNGPYYHDIVKTRTAFAVSHPRTQPCDTDYETSWTSSDGYYGNEPRIIVRFGTPITTVTTTTATSNYKPYKNLLTNYYNKW